jgi:hypothetical protein
MMIVKTIEAWQVKLVAQPRVIEQPKCTRDYMEVFSVVWWGLGDGMGSTQMPIDWFYAWIQSQQNEQALKEDVAGPILLLLLLTFTLTLSVSSACEIPQLSIMFLFQIIFLYDFFNFLTLFF